MDTALRILTWNLFHGRAVPERRRSLEREFTAAIAGWEWDIALLQEVPPWWPARIAAAAHAEPFSVLTSRNICLPLRRLVADRRPDLIKSGGGGANAILVRARAGRVDVHAHRVLRTRPERRVVHGVRLAGGSLLGLWIANVHAQVRPHSLTRADMRLAGETVLRWSGGGRAILGGDTNVPDPKVAGFTDAGGHEVDRVLVHPAPAASSARALTREHGLSDHAPVLVELTLDTV